MNQIVLSLLSAVIGVLIGALLTAHLHRKYDQLKQKRDVLRRFVGYRYFLAGNFVGKSINEPYIALNEAFVVFADSPCVICALKKFRQELKQNQVDHILSSSKRWPSPQKCVSTS